MYLVAHESILHVAKNVQILSRVTALYLQQYRLSTAFIFQSFHCKRVEFAWKKQPRYLCEFNGVNFPSRLKRTTLLFRKTSLVLFRQHTAEPSMLRQISHNRKAVRNSLLKKKIRDNVTNDSVPCTFHSAMVDRRRTERKTRVLLHNENENRMHSIRRINAC